MPAAKLVTQLTKGLSKKEKNKLYDKAYIKGNEIEKALEKQILDNLKKDPSFSTKKFLQSGEQPYSLHAKLATNEGLNNFVRNKIGSNSFSDPFTIKHIRGRRELSFDLGLQQIKDPKFKEAFVKEIGKKFTDIYKQKGQRFFIRDPNKFYTVPGIVALQSGMFAPQKEEAVRVYDEDQGLQPVSLFFSQGGFVEAGNDIQKKLDNL